MGKHSDALKCLTIPLGKFGEHWKGSMGCLWCDLNIQCLKKSPFKGKSLIFPEVPNSKDLTVRERPKLIREAKVKPTINRQRLRGFFAL